VPDLSLSEPLKIVGEFAEAVVRGNKHFKGTLDLKRAIVDIQTETQMQGANLLTVSVSDPSLSIFTSGFFEMYEEGGLWRLPPVEVELEGVTWRLVDIQGTTELSSPNAVLEFEPKAIVMLRRHFGPVSATRGAGMTRAEFERKLANAVKDELAFYCPHLTEVQPIAPETEKEEEEKKRKEAKESGSSGSSSSGQSVKIEGGETKEKEEFAKAVLEQVGIKPTTAAVEKMVAWETAEGGNWQNGAKYNPLNTTLPMVGAGNTGAQGNIKVYTSWAQGVDATAKTLDGSEYEGVRTALEGGSLASFEEAVNGSPWGTKFSGKGAQKPVGGSGHSEGNAKPVQVPYKFAVTSEEDYFAGMTKLAQEVQWPLWQEDNTLNYMRAEDVVWKDPLLRIDVVKKTIQTSYGIKNGKRIKTAHLKTFKKAIAQFTFGFSETEEKAKAEVKEVTKRKVGEVRKRKNKNPGAALTTECTVQLICLPNFIKAGDVIILEDSSGKGPWQTNGYGGRWVVVNATRSIFNVYTECQLAIPGSSTLPLPLGEPKNETETKSSGTVGNADGSSVPSAKQEAGQATSEPKEAQQVQEAYYNCQRIEAHNFPYVFGGGHVANLRSVLSESSPVSGYDCSGAVSAALGGGAANMLPGGEAKTAEAFASWGEAGKGEWMTIWALDTDDPHDSHVLIEFTISKNTKWFEAGGRDPSSGGKFYTTPYPSNLEAAGFKPRHWPGT
jgi:hypothetical protein